MRLNLIILLADCLVFWLTIIAFVLCLFGKAPIEVPILLLLIFIAFTLLIASFEVISRKTQQDDFHKTPHDSEDA